MDVLPEETREAFMRCTELSFLQRDWYLAGGTALALQAGHRRSVDLDFFTPQKTMDGRTLAERFSTAGSWKTTLVDEGTLYGEFYGAKVSLISYPFFTPAEPCLHVGAVSILTPPDIAAMKITAISQRGRKRDFFDLYWLSEHSLPLNESLARAEHQYSVRQNMNHILKSLVYFDDAEGDPEPVLFFAATWRQVKDYFIKEVAVATRKAMGLGNK